MSTDPAIAYIYVLIDPRDEEIRYVGVTKHSPEDRLKGHLKERVCHGHRRHWLDQLGRMGLTPRLQTVQEVTFDFKWDAEIYWIAYFRRAGCNLVNDTDGGEGSRGHTPTPETRAKISASSKRQMVDPEMRRQVGLVHKGKTISPENRKIVSEATTKRWAEWRANGAYTSPETRAKISMAKKGKKFMSPEHQQKLLDAAKRPKSDEHRAAISAANKGKPRTSAQLEAMNKARQRPHSPERTAKWMESMRRYRERKALCPPST